MSLNGENLEQLSQLVEAAQTILIFLPPNAKLDEAAAALAWAGVLRQKNKEVQLVSPLAPAVSPQELEGTQEITTQLGKQNLVVSFAYSPEQVDKVSYHIGESTERFYLTIRPQKGQPPLSQESLEITYAGAEADLLIYVGINDLEQLQPLSGEYAEFFRDTQSIAFSTVETSFGSVKVPINSAAGLCQESAQLFVQLGWELEESVATKLLRGIEDKTDGLTSLATSPDTFETVAALLRAGARRSHRQDVRLENSEAATVTTEAKQVRQHKVEQTVPQTSVETNNGSTAPKTFADVLNRGSSEPATGVLPKHEQPVTVGQVTQQSSPQKLISGRYQGRKRQRSAQG